MADSSDSQVVTMVQLRETIEQINKVNNTLRTKINSIQTAKIKMPSIKRFIGERLRLKGFLTQIKLKINYKKKRLLIITQQVTYIGLFLIGRVIEQFKPHLIEIQANGLVTTNLEVQYIFLIQEGFANRLIQIFGDLELVATVE